MFKNEGGGGQRPFEQCSKKQTFWYGMASLSIVDSTLHRGFILLYSSVLVSPAVILTCKAIIPQYLRKNIFLAHPNMLMWDPGCSAENDNGSCRLRHQVRVHLLVVFLVFVFVFVFAGVHTPSVVWSASLNIDNFDTFRLMLMPFPPLCKKTCLSVVSM